MKQFSIIIKGLKLPKIGGMALFPFIILREKTPSKVLIHHEEIHLRQQLEMLILPFYVWYVLEWLIHYVRVKDFWAAYRLISFEKEAYAQEQDLNYLNERPFWSFLYYL